jgi:O-antigen/teichoic acid export membrane protein
VRRRAELLTGATPRGRALVTVLGGFAVQPLLLVSGVIVARLLGVEDRGHLALLWVVSLSLAYLGAAGIPSATTYWVAREPGASRPLARLVVRVALVQAAVATALQAAVLAIAVGGERGPVLVSALISLPAVPAMIAVMHGMAFLQGFQRFRTWSLLRLLPPLLYTAAVVPLAAVGAGLIAVTAAWVGSFVIAGIVAVERAAAALPAATGARPPSFRTLQSFGAKAFLGATSPSDTLQLDQALVGLFVSPTALGLYVVGIAFTNLPRLVAQSLGYVAYPHVAKKPDLRLARRALWSWAAVALVAAGAITVVLELAAGWLVPFFFGSAFEEAVPLTRILLLAALLVSVRRVLGDGARGAGSPALGTVAEAASTVVLVPGIAIVAGSVGVTGAAWTLVIAGAVGLAVMLGGLARSAPARRDARGEPARAGDGPRDPALAGDGRP